MGWGINGSRKHRAIYYHESEQVVFEQLSGHQLFAGSRQNQDLDMYNFPPVADC